MNQLELEGTMLHYEMCSVNIPFHIFYPLCTQPDITFSKLALHKNITKSALAVKESIMNDIPKLFLQENGLSKTY